MFKVRRSDFRHVELPDGVSLMVAEERKRCPESGAKGGANLWGISTDHREATVVHPQVILKLGEAPNLARAFWSPIAAIEAEDERKAVHQL